jgi:subtilisin-like proprotein convertase family protein
MVGRFALLAAAAAAVVLLALPAGALAIVVDHDSAAVTETSPGGDGLVGPGDTFAVTETLHTSDPSLTGVAGSLTSSTPGLSITQGSSSWPDLAFGMPTANATPFTGSLSSAATCGVNLDFAVHLHSDQGDAVVPFTVPTGVPGPLQPFTSVDVPKPINDNSSVSSSFTVPTAGRVKDLRVRIGRITHSYVGDLRIELIAPDNTKVTLLSPNSTDSGDNLVNTVFDSSAATSITASSPPFTGSFRPEESLHKLDGHQQQGTWTLKVTDTNAPDTGTLDAWGADVSFAVCSGEPIASYTATPNPALPGDPVQLDASGSVDPNGSITRYEWDLDGDGTFETDGGTTPTLSRTFTDRGRYPVGLRVTDNDGRTDVFQGEVNVTHPPTASFTSSPASPSTGQTVTFDGSGSTDPDGPIARYEWDLDGNGTFETDGGASATTTHAYGTTGDVAVHLRVTDTDGATATTTRSLHIANRAPTAAFAAPAPLLAGVAGVFNATSSSDPDGSIVDYAWDFDGNGTYETAGGSTPTISHQFASAGTYPVGLQVTDNNGATGTTSVSVHVTQPPLAALVLSPSTVQTGTPVSFDASGSTDPDGSIVGYEWDLDGNGSYETDSGTNPRVTKAYPNHGVIPVRVRVTDNDGGKSVATGTLTVNDPPPPVGAGSGSGGSGGSSNGGGGSSGSSGGGGGSGGSSGGGSTSSNGSAGTGAPGTSGGSGGGTGGSGSAGGSGASPAGPLRASLDGPAVQTAKDVARSGLAVTCSTDRPATCALTAEVSASVAKRLRVKVPKKATAVTVGSASASSAAAQPGAVRLVLSSKVRSALKRRGRISVTVRATVTSASGERAQVTRTIAIR